MKKAMTNAIMTFNEEKPSWRSNNVANNDNRRKANEIMKILISAIMAELVKKAAGVIIINESGNHRNM